MDTRDDAVEDRSDDARADAARTDRPVEGDPDANAPEDPPATDRSPAPGESETTDDGPAPGLGEAFGEDGPELGPLEPGTPTVENVVFVVLGALATVLLFVTAF